MMVVDGQAMKSRCSHLDLGFSASAQRSCTNILLMAAKLTFWKPGTTGPGSTLDRATEAEGNVVQSAPSYSSSIQAQRERLPIFKYSKFGLSQ
jgi:hypothetical protein